MRIVYFTQSLQSCWNHGNAHFIRGVLRELIARGHAVRALEPEDSWSRTNLVAAHGASALDHFRTTFPELKPELYGPALDVDNIVGDADLVIVHEWTTPEIVAAVGQARRHHRRPLVLFHDTHHRAVSEPAAMKAYDLSAYDGVLAFGETLAEVYRAWGWGERVFAWHEAADTRLFRPPAMDGERQGLVWIGNWGDGERSAELETYLLRAARDAGLPLDVYGVRYPREALDALARHGAAYRNWLPNARAPDIFARHLATVHVPRRFYTQILPGIPTIRVFEALACGIPLVSAPWNDAENLFTPGEDFLVARSGDEMTRHLRALAGDPDLRTAIAARGLDTIHRRHTCRHRVDELLEIVARLHGSSARKVA